MDDDKLAILVTSTPSALNQCGHGAHGVVANDEVTRANVQAFFCHTGGNQHIHLEFGVLVITFWLYGYG